MVEDEKDILNLFYEYLQACGYQTISFDNPIDALNYIDNNNISDCSLIITDYKMPQMNWIDFIKQIREKYSNGSNNFQIKFMLITAFMKSDLDFHKALDYIKIDKIIEKPIRLELFRRSTKNNEAIILNLIKK